MKRSLVLAAISGLFSCAVMAQTPTPPASRPVSPTNTGTTAPATGGGGTGAEGKVAIINTAAFRTGITEMKIKLDALNSEFEPKSKELQGIQDQLNNLKNQIQTQGATVQPAVRNQWQEQATDKEKELKRKSEDYDALAKKRLEEVSGPIYERIGRALEQYAQKRGIMMVIEAGAAQNAGLIVFANEATDITADFMTEYNRSNPASGGAPPAAAPKKN
jgi:Skp family chaperone for outer membrane proteins